MGDLGQISILVWEDEVKRWGRKALAGTAILSGIVAFAAIAAIPLVQNVGWPPDMDLNDPRIASMVKEEKAALASLGFLASLASAAAAALCAISLVGRTALSLEKGGLARPAGIAFYSAVAGIAAVFASSVCRGFALLIPVAAIAAAVFSIHTGWATITGRSPKEPMLPACPVVERNHGGHQEHGV